MPTDMWRSSIATYHISHMEVLRCCGKCNGRCLGTALAEARVPRRYLPHSGAEATEEQAGIDTSEAKRVRENIIDTRLASLGLADVVKIAERVGVEQVECRWQPAVAQGEQRNRGLPGAGGAERVTMVTLCAADRYLVRVIAEDLLDRNGFRRIVE